MTDSKKIERFHEILRAQQAYLSSFPTPKMLMDELESLKFHGRFLREDKEISYDGDICIKFDDSDKMCFFMKAGIEKYLSKNKMVGVSGKEKYKLEADKIENIEGSIPIPSLLGGPCPVKLHPLGKCTWVIAKLDSFPKGTKFFVGFTNLQIYSTSYPKFDIGSFTFNFRDTEDEYWKLAKNSIDGKITNVCRIEALKDSTLRELEKILFSMGIFFEIITSNRIRHPIIKFILPNELYGYLLYDQNSNTPATNGFRMFHEHYSLGIQYPGFLQHAIKLIHKKMYSWNLCHFAEHLISYSNNRHIEKKMLFAILALETLTTGYLLDNNLATPSEIEGMNIKQKIEVLNKKIRFIKCGYYKIGELNSHRNMLFHQGKLPNYDINVLKENTVDFGFKWLELAWLIFLKLFDFQCIFNKPPTDCDQNFQLANFKKCKIQECHLKNQCNRNS